MPEQVSYLRVKKEKRGFKYNPAGDLGFNPPLREKSQVFEKQVIEVVVNVTDGVE